MLLEVTPSMLHALGISQSSLIERGNAHLAPAKGQPAKTRLTSFKVLRISGKTVLHNMVSQKHVEPKQVAAAAAAKQAVTAQEVSAVTPEMLSAQQMADAMHCSPANVYDQEKRGHLFSVVPPGRKNGRMFPSFQLSAHLDRPLLHALIAAYAERRVPLNLLWDFLRSAPTPFGGLSGLEVLQRGRSEGGARPISAVARTILGLADEKRREFVLEAALEDLTHASV